MLDGTRNSHRNIEVGSDNLSRLANLQIIWDIARINSSARGSNGSAKLIGKFFENGEIFSRFHSSTTAHHNTRRDQFGSVTFGYIFAYPLYHILSGDINLSNLSFATLNPQCLFKSCWSHREDLNLLIKGFHLRKSISCVKRTNKRVLTANFNDIRDRRNAKQGTSPWQEVSTEFGCGAYNMTVGISVLCRLDSLGHGFCQQG
mmetsp:Transcript_47549/g.70393  ORF Transcript_47549/g.70393 Transcript_47549/m.70393 type:complete len:203 (+) Transcript_47549:187-795(+)